MTELSDDRGVEMAGTTSVPTVMAPLLARAVAVPSAAPVASVVVEAPAPVLSGALAAAGAVPGVMGQLELVISAGRPGGLSGVSGDQALTVVEAVEAVKAWADAIALAATAVLVGELESDFSHLAPESLTSRGWRSSFARVVPWRPGRSRSRPGLGSPRASAWCGWRPANPNGPRRCVRR